MCAPGMRQLDNHTPPYDLGGRLIGEATFELPADLPLGYHRLYIQAGCDRIEHRADRRPGEARAAAAARRQADLGAGHPALQRAVRKILGCRRFDRSHRPRGVVGASTAPGYILVNPLHAAAPIAPMEPSPYLPTSRRFVNPLYLRVEAIPEFAYVRKRGRYPQGHGVRCRRTRGAPS